MAEGKELDKKKSSEVAASEEPSERFIRPRTSVYEYDDNVKIIMDIPGVSKDNLDISYKQGELMVEGRREQWNREDMKPCYCERFDGHYRRVFSVDETLDARKIDANLSQGVLELTIPKTEAVKPRKIEIKTG
jgi:HSP20 family molecular chaperone IbpA